MIAEPGRAGPRTRLALATLLIAMSIVAISGQFLYLYVKTGFTGPAGFDTPKYIWRANLVVGEGLRELADSSPYREHADRPGYPALASVYESVNGISPLRLGFVLPALMGAVVGLAAGAFARRSVREPGWAFPVYAIVVGASVNVAVTATGLIDNLIIDGLLVAAAVTALLAAEGMPAFTATLLLIAGATLTHWPFTLVFVAILGALALVVLPMSIREWRSGGRPLGTPSARLASLVAGSAVVLGGALLLAPDAPQPPVSSRRSFLRKLGRFVPWYRFEIPGPMAAIGIPALWIPKRRERRWGLALALIWAGAGAAAVALLHLGVAAPAHRLLGFGLGLPILAAAGLTGLGRVISRLPPRPVGIALAALVVLAGLAGSGLISHLAWMDRAALKLPGLQVAQARAAGRYLQEVGNDHPVIFVINPPVKRYGQATTLYFGATRASLPSNQIRNAYIYLGDPAMLLSGRPTLREGDKGFNKVSQRHWEHARPLLADDPVILMLSAFNLGFRPREPVPGLRLAEGVRLLSGPTPADLEGLTPVLPTAPSAGALIWIFVSALLLLWVVGMGWSASLVPAGWFVRVSLAPALAIAALVLGQAIVARLGLDTPGLRLPSVVVVAVLGWIPFAIRSLKRGRGRHAPPVTDRGEADERIGVDRAPRP